MKKRTLESQDKSSPIAHRPSDEAATALSATGYESVPNKKACITCAPPAWIRKAASA